MNARSISDGKPFGEGRLDAEALESELIDTMAKYKRRVAGLYRPLSPQDIPSVSNAPMLVSRKLDGELWFLYGRGRTPFLANPRGRTISGRVPVLEQAASLPEGVLIAGELHTKPPQGRERVGDIARLLAGGKKASTKELYFTGFDVVSDVGGAMPPVAYEGRLARLEELLKLAQEPLGLITTEKLMSAEDLRAHYQAVVEGGGAEGLIVRVASGMVYKLKPTIEIDAVIIAFTEKADEPGLVRSVLLGLMHQDGHVQLLGGCGNVGTSAQRKALFETLSTSRQPSGVRYASETGGLYTFVSPQVVVAIRVNDLQYERSDGGYTETLCLSFDTKGWHGRGVRPSPRPIHPVLERVRTDKQANTTDVRIGQIEPWLVLRGEGQRDVSLTAASSTILRREVWAKEAKGHIAVRKLVIWKTNKDTTDPSFPPFVVHWTDYSAGRATPIEREVRPAPNEAEAKKLADILVAENIKKGWSKK